MKFIGSVFIVLAGIGFVMSVSTVQVSADEIPSWIKNSELKGDLRLRNEYKNDDPGTDNNRQRLRFRLGFKTKVNDMVKIGFGLATGSSDSPTSTNQTLEQEFQSKSIWLDYVFAKYTASDRLNFTGGKFKSPFFHTDMLWDSDIRFDGFAFKLNNEFSPDNRVYLTGGFFPIDNRSTGSDINLYAAQVGTKSEFGGKSIKLKTGFAIYSFSNLKGVTASSLAEERSTNTYTDGALEYDYVIFNPTVKLYFKNVWGHRGGVGFLGEYAHNSEAPEENDAWRAGIWLGQSKVKKTRQWKLLTQYTSLEKDVFFDSFPDADLNFGGTNGKGWEIIFDYGLAKNVIFSMDYYHSEIISGAKADQQVFQVDLIFKF